MIKPHLWAVLIILFVLVQGERRKYKGLYSSMFVVGKINHCPVYRCILFYLAVCAAAAKLLQSCPVWPHKWQPPRLPHPWDSPGKKTGVGCHFLLQCMKVKSESEVVSDSSRPQGLAAYQAPQSMGFSRQEYWSGLPLPSPLTVYIVYKKDNHPNLQHLVFLDVKEIVPVCDKNSKQIHCVHSVLKFIGKTYENWRKWNW